MRWRRKKGDEDNFTFFRIDCRSPMLSRSVSSLSRSTPNLSSDQEIEDKLVQMEKMINEQKEIINQQKDLITEQKEKLYIFQNTEEEEVNNSENDKSGLMEDID